MTVHIPYVDPAFVSDSKRPTARQVYALAHLLLEAAGVPFPKSRMEMTDLIGRIQLSGFVRDSELA
jgi:hypothetical protein